jgi:Tryptophan halogenase
MRHEAVAAGARLHAAALSVDEILAWPARYRLDCTGRAGVLAKPLGHRRHEAGHRTVALVGVWRRDSSWSLDDPSHTLLESYADGWAWSVPIDDRHRALAVMVDPRTTALAKGDGARAVYLAEIAKTRHLAASMDGATLGDGPFGWDASMYLARHLTGPDWLLVGDAGSFVDPLSSAGVKKALASGWLAAVVTNSALHDTALARPALELFAKREAAVYQQFLAITKQFMAEAGGTKPEAHPFWSERAAEDAAPVVPRAAVEAAFERLKGAQQVRLHRAPGVRTEVRPALGERLLTMEPHIVTDDLPDGVRFVLDVDVAALVDLAAGAWDVPSLHDLYADRIGRVSWPSFLTALATAIARKWLILR